MKVLRPTQPTSEQLTVITNHKPGVFVVRGAAGSGKTTTALYRLKFTVRYWQRRRPDGFIDGPVRVLVLTYNKTLRGYIEELTKEQIKGNDVELTISTFAKWATDRVPYERILQEHEHNGKLDALAAALPLSEDFVRSEVDYVLGRFMPDRLAEYIECERQGRGRSPRMPASLRRRLLDEVIVPIQEWKKEQQAWDWSDLANPPPARGRRRGIGVQRQAAQVAGAPSSGLGRPPAAAGAAGCRMAVTGTAPGSVASGQITRQVSSHSQPHGWSGCLWPGFAVDR